jgi:calnexin
MQNDILFDNIYIGHSVEDANKLKEETFDLKVKAEKAEEAATAPKPKEKEKSPMETSFKEDPVAYVKTRIDLFINIAKRDPLEAIKFVPEVAGGAGVVAVTVLAILASLLFGGSSPSKEQVKDAAKKAKDAAVESKEKAAEAVASGVDKVQADANKRTTRSAAS